MADTLTVYVLGLQWRIETVAQLHDFGDCDCNQRLIRIRSGQDREQQAETLIHELLHAIWGTLALKDKEPEEHAVHSLAVGLASVVLDARNSAVLELLASQSR